MASSRTSIYQIASLPFGGLRRSRDKAFSCYNGTREHELTIVETASLKDGSVIHRDIHSDVLDKVDFVGGNTTRLKFLMRLEKPYESESIVLHKTTIYLGRNYTSTSVLQLEVDANNDARREEIESAFLDELKLESQNIDEPQVEPSKGSPHPLVDGTSIPYPPKITLRWLFDHMPWSGWSGIAAILASVFAAGVWYEKTISKIDKEPPNPTRALAPSSAKTPHPPASGPAATAPE